MSLESELFARNSPDFSRFPAAGFVRDKKKKCWRAQLSFKNGEFRAELTVTDAGEVSGRVFDADTGDEYLAVHIPSQSGAFVAGVRESYAAALRALAQKCYFANDFKGDQANRIAALIKTEFRVSPEFPWGDGEGGVFRDERTRKWFALIMEIPRERLVAGVDGDVEVMNVKAAPQDVPTLWNERGIFRCYHMNKQHWVTLTLDDTLSDARIIELVRDSRAFAARGGVKSGKPAAVTEPNAWIVPANYKYWDVEKHFGEDPVQLWKQTSAVHPGDTVFMYIGAPVSAVWCRCEVLETDIPYQYDDENVSMKKVMKLRMTRCYGRELIPLSLMKRCGVLAVRGARRMTAELKAEIERLEAALPPQAPQRPVRAKKKSKRKPKSRA
ncbi:MAG: MmcQ/YjbR family DNA-binding protein [Pyramidobacter sp.]|nr:MmcQ/YjbR family DNA-binding protein [Pyramidobacter sp.]